MEESGKAKGGTKEEGRHDYSQKRWRKKGREGK